MTPERQHGRSWSWRTFVRWNTSFAVLVAVLVAGVVVAPVGPASAGVATGWLVSASYPPGVANLVDIACPSSIDCFAVGDVITGENLSAGVVLATTDGGSTWAAQPLPAALGSGVDSNLVSVACPSPSDCFAVGTGTTGEVIVGTTNAGASWTVQDTIDASAGMPAIACPSTTDCYAIADTGSTAYPSLLLATSSGGSSWTSLPLPPDLPQLDDVTCQSETSCLAVGGGDVLDTTDGGSSWTNEALGSYPGAFYLAKVDCISPATCYAAGFGDVLFTSDDSGTTWTGRTLPVAEVDSIACASTVDCFIGSGAAMLGTTNGGGSWATQQLPPGNAGGIGGLSCPSPTTCFAVQASDQVSWSENSLILVGPGAAPDYTTTAISTSASHPVAGQSVTYSATVAPATGTGTPTGTVTFAVGSTPLCVATLTGGTGSCSASAAPLGDDTVTGTYSGDVTFVGSSGSAALDIGLSTTTTVSVQPTSVTQDSTVLYSASVAPSSGSGTPSGSVTFTVGATTLCTASLAGGSGSCSGSDAPAGSDQVTGTYSGDQNFGSSAGTAALFVQPGTVTQVSLQPGEATFGQLVTYSASVTSADGAGTPTGTVAFTIGSTPLCVATLSGGAGSCSASTAPAGYSWVSGTYSGDQTFAGSAGGAALAVGLTTTTVSVSPTSVPIGQQVTYSANVTADAGTGIPTGTVAFTSGGYQLCTATLSGGTGSCAASNAPGGSDPVFGTYSGDGSFTPSTGYAPLSVGLTTTTISVEPANVAPGQSVTYTAAVAAEATSGVPTGSVTFAVGGTTLCAAPLAGGSGSCSSSDAPLGMDEVTATYSGSPTLLGSTASTAVAVGMTTTTVSVDPSTAAAGAAVTYAATVASAQGVPTGTVSFTSGGYPLCTAALTDGAGSCVAPINAPIGPDTVVGTYSGASSFPASVGSATLTVTPVPSELLATDTVLFGQNVRFSAGVLGDSDGSSPSSGTVTFSLGTTTLCTASLVASDLAQCSASDVPLGTDTVTATYSGNAWFLGSSTQISLSLGISLTAVSVDPTSVLSGQDVTYSATVTGPSGTSSPSGTVTFSVGTTTLCTAPVVAGAASCSATNAPAGVDAAVGTYSGDAELPGSFGWTTLDVVVAPTTTAVSVDPTTVTHGQPVTYSATVTALGSTATPTGEVLFTVGTTELCGATLSGGTASCSTNTAPLGDDTVTGTYAGDGSFAASSASTMLLVHVKPPTISGFSPSQGQVGTVVTITGANLGGATSVTFDGVSAAVGADAATSIAATVPAGTTTGKITVVTSGGTAKSKTKFTVKSS